MQVDNLVYQQRVVMKNLGSNYQKVNGILGATIFGEDRATLILDVAVALRLNQKHKHPAGA